MKKVVIAVAIVLLILMNTVAYLLVYKKYNDLIDYFNQDSQLTSERLDGIDAKVKEMGAKVDEMSSQLDGKTEQVIADIRKDLSPRIESLETDIASIRQKLGMKAQLPKR